MDLRIVCNIHCCPELNATETAQTYTIYDDFGRVAYVIPPETTKKMVTSLNWDPNHANYASMIFKYVYDSRGRMTSKTVPSGGTTTIAYDRLDRPVLTTDAKGFKVFTRYDILSRPIVSGRYKGTASPGPANPLFETSNTTAPHYYTSTSFPTDNNLDVYKVFFPPVFLTPRTHVSSQALVNGSWARFVRTLV
ncbi:MAG TPA: RHS repeat domain-containing protein [Saprospiraceae bacterium]|nr:RHS repeat domain-containing protein [Saprospiraceae bacterium]